MLDSKTNIRTSYPTLQSASPAPRGVQPPNRQSIALISVHGDPAIDIGKEEAGGQNVYVRKVGEALAKLGWQVDMFTRKSSPDAAEIVQHSPHCRTIRLKAGPEEFIPRDRLYEYLPEFVESFIKIASKQGYPLVHTNYWLSGRVGLMLQQQYNLQWIHTYHSLGAVKYQSMDQVPAVAQIRLAVEKQILETADRIVATSPQEQDHMQTLVSWEGNIDIIPCGTDISNFHALSSVEARAQLKLNPEEHIVLYVGRFDPRKGIATLVKACAQLKKRNTVSKLRLIIVGGSDPKRSDGAERQRIEQITQHLGLSDCTTFAGQVGHDQLPLYYAAADVCVVPSHYEPFGLVAIEAMACGAPVVASDVGGLKFTVVPEETGLLAPPKDETAFSHAIERILADKAWAEQLRRNATQRVQDHFSWDGVAGQLSDLYRHLLASSLTQAPKLTLPQITTTPAPRRTDRVLVHR
ncbi:MAG: glycosyltransferase family 4 protein [Prochlorothrix sp.]